MKAVVVEDSPRTQAWLLPKLNAVAGLRVVGMATGESEAIALIEELRPDLVTLDLDLLPGHGFNVLKAMRATGNHCKVLVLTGQDIVPLEIMAREFGADALFDKCYGVPEAFLQIKAWVKQYH